MHNKAETRMNNTSVAGQIFSYIFGLIVLALGLINSFWGNDPEFGIFLVLLSFVYFVPVNDMLKKLTRFSIPGFAIVKVLLGIFIIWASLGVGELFDKIDLMIMDL